MARRFAEGLGLPPAVLSDVESLSRFGVGAPSLPNPATAGPGERLFAETGRGNKKEKTMRLTLKEFRKQWRRLERGGRGGGGGGSGGGSGSGSGGGWDSGGGGGSRKRQRPGEGAPHVKPQVGDDTYGDSRGSSSSSGGSDDDGKGSAKASGSGSGGGGSDSDSDSDNDCGDDEGSSDEGEGHDAVRAEERLRYFLADASPVHAMALVVAAAKGCPGWESWSFTRPALLPPLGVATSTAAAVARGKATAAAGYSAAVDAVDGAGGGRGGEEGGPGTSGDDDDGGDDGSENDSAAGAPRDNARWPASSHSSSSNPRRSSDSWIAPQLLPRSGSVGAGANSTLRSGLGTPSATAGKARGVSPGETALSGAQDSGGGAGGGGGGGIFGSPFVPTHPDELRLLLRGRLPDYLGYVERWLGGEENFGNWLGSGETMPTVLETLAEEASAAQICVGGGDCCTSRLGV